MSRSPRGRGSPRPTRLPPAGRSSRPTPTSEGRASSRRSPSRPGSWSTRSAASGPSGAERADAALVYAWESWALAYFLDRQESAARRGVSTALVGDMLASRKDSRDWLAASFGERLGLRSEADWAALDREFRAFALDLLL